MNIISANDLKTKGVGAIELALTDQPDAAVTITATRLEGEVVGIAQRVNQSQQQNHPRDADHEV